MNNYLVLTIIADDKPGLLELLAQTVNDNGGNWLDGRMSHLAGKFTGILELSVDPEHQTTLTKALEALADEGFKVVVESANALDRPACHEFNLSVAGLDRTGIVYEIAQAFASRHINMSELETDYSSMPWSGEPLFQAKGVIEVPDSVDMDELYDQLDTIAEELAVDIRLESPEEEEPAAQAQA